MRRAYDTTKTVTIMYQDSEACLARWEKKGWNPISVTTFEERDPRNKSLVVTYATIVFAHMGKPK